MVAFAQSFEIDEGNLLKHSREYIFELYIFLINIYAIFEYNIGASDPIPQTMAEILEKEPYLNIAKMYIKFPRDEERYNTTLKKILDKWNEILTHKSRNNPAPDKIYTDHDEKILQCVFRMYGNMFENMTCEDFVYLFGGLNEAPTTYNPPFYRAGDTSTFNSPQPRGLRRLVLSMSDKAEGKTEHDWGRNKDKVAYLDVERNIREIVKDVSNVDLKPL